jgi:hypothetical protein
MTTSRWLVCFVAAWFLVAGDGDPAEVHVSTVARDGRVHVSCAVTGGLTPDMEQALQSGLTTTFTYDVDLRRAVSVWLDRGVGVSTVSASAQYDTLTGRYQVSRSVDGRIEDSRVSENKADVARFITSFERLPLFTTADLEPNVEYLVRVRLRTRPRVNWFIWPFSRADAVGFARFTFIP